MRSRTRSQQRRAQRSTKPHLRTQTGRPQHLQARVSSRRQHRRAPQSGSKRKDRAVKQGSRRMTVPMVRMVEPQLTAVQVQGLPNLTQVDQRRYRLLLRSALGAQRSHHISRTSTRSSDDSKCLSRRSGPEHKWMMGSEKAMSDGHRGPHISNVRGIVTSRLPHRESTICELIHLEQGEDAMLNAVDATRSYSGIRVVRDASNHRMFGTVHTLRLQLLLLRCAGDLAAELEAQPSSRLPPLPAVVAVFPDHALNDRLAKGNAEAARLAGDWSVQTLRWAGWLSAGQLARRR